MKKWSYLHLSIVKNNFGIRIISHLVSCVCVFTTLPLSAQVSITGPDPFVYQQFFTDLSMASNAWTNNSTLPGWYAASNPTVDGVLTPTNSTACTKSSGTSTAGLFSFGSSGSSPDRSLGSVSKDDSGEITYGVLFQNNSGQLIQSITLTLAAEQWRRAFEEDRNGHQRLKVSYTIGPIVDVTAAGLFNEQLFTELPEAYLISIDTTTKSASSNLNGNEVTANLAVTFPVLIPVNWQFFLRFYDENAPGVDVPIAVDNISVTFSQNTAPRISAVSGFTAFSYLDMGIVANIPDEDSVIPYPIPSETELGDWQSIFETFYSTNWDQTDASDYGYQVVHFTDVTGKHYIILRKESTSNKYWGTYARALNPTNTKVVIQAPHPANDEATGRQAAAVFYHANISNFMVAGHNRCVGGNSACHGGTKSCVGENDPEVPFRMSDVAHTDESIFHVATTVLATAQPQLVFIQLHGFGQKTNDPHFFVSCGILDAHQKSVPDYPVILREHLLAINPSLEVTITHVDNDSRLGARDNVQGRYLNEYPLDDCAGAASPTTVTNRFLHIEQYNNIREIGTYYVPMAMAINNAINNSTYLRAIPIESFPNPYLQNFDNLSNFAGPHTWGNNLHLPGWYAVRGEVGLFSNYVSADGSETTGGLYAYGDGPSQDRAMGTLNTGEETGHTAFGVLFKNKTGLPITGLHLDYTAEQWRGANASSQQVTLSYAISDSMDLSKAGLLNHAVFTNIPEGNLVTINDAANGAMNGNITFTNITDLTIPVYVEDEQEIFIRFYDEDVPSITDKVMALDDFNISFSNDPALLVSWLSFEVNSDHGFPKLRWRTTNETGCDRYQILRSTNGKDFQEISTMSCQKNRETNDYEYTDHSYTTSETTYYRIAQHDMDGRATHSKVKVYASKSSNHPKVYYENGFFKIEGDSNAELEIASVIDFMGRELCIGTPTLENSKIYSFECPVAAGRFLLVKLVYNSEIYVKRVWTEY